MTNTQNHKQKPVKVGAIILAAGESKRLGKPKQLLPWRGKPLIWHIVQLALDGNLDPIIVVTGSHHQEIEKVIKEMPVAIVYNRDWKLGQSSSIKRGLSVLSANTEACVFLLCDQPQIPVSLVHKIIDHYQKTRSCIIAPLVNGQRGNPVLFCHDTFKALLHLKGNEGGRKIFRQYQITYIQWEDVSILIDIDTEDDYMNLLRLQ